MEIPFYDNYVLADPDEELKRLRREIAFLTEKRRRIVFRFYYEGKSISVIAREMDIPEGTVKWHLNKARNELKEGFSMERKIGKLGLSPVTALDFGHSGDPGSNGEPDFYLGDRLNLNVVYSVYHQPRTAEEIAEELGMTPVFLQDRIDFLEGNGLQDLIIAWGVGGFIGSTIALMVMDILYGEGIFRPLTEQERVTANLLMFSDMLPE